MKCKECNNYIPSEKFAGGRCKHLPKTAMFPDTFCCAVQVIYDSDDNPVRHKFFEPIAKPKKQPREKPDESALGEDPQVTYS